MLKQFVEVSDSITVNRCDNGWLVEVSGTDKNSRWKNSKIICSDEKDLLALIEDWNSKKLTD